MKRLVMKHLNTLMILVFFAFCAIQALEAQTVRNSGYFNVLDYGAVRDGKTKNTDAIKKTIDAAVKQGGGTVYFPAGDYLTGPIHVKSNITIFIDAGALIKFSQDFDDYLPMVTVRWEGTACKSFSPLFYGFQVENVAIRGRGKIDGQGQVWWDVITAFKNHDKSGSPLPPIKKYQDIFEKENKETIRPDTWNWNTVKFLRPPFIQFFESKNIMVEGITIVNSPFWTIDPAFCDNVTVNAVSIKNPPDSYNTDGINPTSCSNVHISNSHISVGDDCITIKSGRDEDGRRIGKPCENITITNCTMLDGHGGVVIGSEMSGDVRKVTISNCVFDGTQRGIRIKSMRGRGGVIEEIRVSNIVMKNIQDEAIKLNMFYKKSPVEPLSVRTPKFRNIHFSNITASNTRQAGFLLGLPEMPIENISFNDINIDAEVGFTVKDANNIEFHNVQVNTSKGTGISAENVKNLELDGIRTLAPNSDTPFIRLNNVQDVFVYDNFPVAGTEPYISLQGANSANVVLMGNNFTKIKNVIKKAEEVPGSAVTEE